MDMVKLYSSFLAASILITSVHSAQQANEDLILVEENNCFGLLQGRIAGLTKGRDLAYLRADFLYLVPYEGGLEYAFSQDSPEPPGIVLDIALIPTVQNGHFERIDSKWLPGFRLEAGMRLPVDEWYAYAKWTRIVGDMSSSTSIPSLNTGNLAPIWLGAGSTQSGYERALEASATWNLHYNVADLAVVRSYFSSAQLSVSVHSGLQGASINQQFRADYSGGTITTLPTYFKGKNNFQAIGLFGECDMGWYIAKNWKLMGGFSGSVNFGRYKLQQQVLAAITDSISSLPYSLHDILNQKEYRTRFAYEANLGIEWNHFFGGGWGISLNAMYHLVEWLDLNQLRRFTFANGAEDRYFFSTNGNLSFQGISASVGVGY